MGKDAADLCTQAWQMRFPGRRGIPVIGARQFVGEPATKGLASVPDRGLSVASHQAFSGQRGDALCGFPVQLQQGNMGKPFAILRDLTWEEPNASRFLAHELGHNLFLGHGNGLDDNHDGRPAGIAGPRRYDEYCDRAWLKPPANTVLVEDIGTATTGSLMQHTSCSADLRRLQVQTARGVVRLRPGFVDGTPVPVVGERP